MEAQNKFLSININRAILSSRYDMRGYLHPLGFRMDGIQAKGLSYLPINLIHFSASIGIRDENDKEPECTINPEIMFYYTDNDLTYEKVLNLCKKFFVECNYIQKEEIQLLLKDVLNRTEELKKEAELKGEKNFYIRPLDKNTNWGKIMLGLMETFDVKAEEPVAIKQPFS